MFIRVDVSCLCIKSFEVNIYIFIIGGGLLALVRFAVGYFSQ